MQCEVLFSSAQILLLVAALSTDTFVAGAAYGSGGIRIPVRSALLINAVSALFLGTALLLGSAVRILLPAGVVTLLCAALLFVLGGIKLFESTLKAWLKRSVSKRRELSFRVLDFHFLLQVYADNLEADSDCSKVLSPKEALSLAVAVSMDGLAAGLGAGLMQMNLLLLLLCSFLLGMLAVMGGCALGNRLARKTGLNLSWLSGAVLIALSLSKLLL